MSAFVAQTNLAGQVTLTPAEFQWFRRFLRERTGIELNPGKENLVMGRLDRRLRHHELRSYREYFAILERRDWADEALIALDLMTTNETYFFREQQHFDLLPSLVAANDGRTQPVRVWSAASSTGEEAFSIALTLADCLPGRKWEVLGTDLSSQVIETARRGHYPLEAAERIPIKLLQAYCLKGRDERAGMLTVRADLRARVTFEQANLVRPLGDLGPFDVIFLRNVMIYFNGDTKRQVVNRVASFLRPGGVLLTGHAETLTGLGTGMTLVSPSVYRAGP